MPKQVLFLQGAGEGAYEEDARLAESLRNTLGPEYEVTYPAMPDEVNTPYNAWKQRIEMQLAAMHRPVSLVGHSVGSSILLKSLSEIAVKQPIPGIFVMATPFWGGDGWRYEGYQELELPHNLADKLPQGTPVFLYHCQDDDTVPYEHLALYQKLLPHAIVRQLDAGGHQFNNDLSLVSEDIQTTAIKM